MRPLAALLLCAILLGGCDSDPSTDAGPGTDGSTDLDAGPGDDDGGTADDAGDGDGGATDGGAAPRTSAQITLVRGTPTGAINHERIEREFG